MDSSSSIISSMITSFLGPCKSYKYVVQDSETHTVKCPHQLLQVAVSSDPFCYIIEAALADHHQKFCCSSMSFLAMWYFWNQEFRLILHEGCNVSDIVEESFTILEDVISLLTEITKDIHSFNLVSKKTKKTNYCSNVKSSVFAPNRQSNSSISSANCIPAGVRYSSRHYSPFLANSDISEEIGSNKSGIFDNNIKVNEEVINNIRSFLEKLSHDDTESAKLLTDVWVKQISSTNTLKFCKENILVLPLMLPSLYSTVIDGLILKSKIFPLYDQDTFLDSKTLIIKGSITYDYVHLGYHTNFKVSVKKTPEELDISEKEIWLRNCCDLLTELHVNILLVHGNVDVDIASFCASHSILLISSVPWTAIEIICLSLKTYPCTYLLDCDIKNIVENLVVRKWQPAFENTRNADIFFQIDMNPGIKMKPCTVILCHPNPSFLACLEHQFMHLISRLSLATSNDKVLPGGGKTEEWCYQIMIKNLKGANSKRKVSSAIASGFHKYFETVNQKIEMKGTLFDEALDEMTSKIGAWKSALSLTMMTLQCDSVLINDPDNIVVEELDLDLLGYL